MELFSKLKFNKNIPPLESQKGSFVVDDIVGVSVLVSTYFKNDPDNYLIVARNLYNAQNIYNLLVSFLGKENVLLFPVDELIRSDLIAQSKEMVAQRLYVLNEIIKNKNKKVVVTSVTGAIRYLPSSKRFIDSSFSFEVDKTYDLSDIKVKLSKAGYLKVNKVDSSLQFAARGDIVDIFSINNEHPVRIEFFGDVIESIRFFDIATQTSIKSVKKIEILPSSDVLFSDEEAVNSTNILKSHLNDDIEKLSLLSKERLNETIEELIDKVITSNLDQGVYKYYSLLSNDLWCLFDYCYSYKKILVDKDQINKSLELYNQESLHYLIDLYEDGKCLRNLSIGWDFESIVKPQEHLWWTSTFKTNDKDFVFSIKPIPYQSNKRSEALEIIRAYLNDEYSLLILMDTKEHIYLLQDMLSSINIQYDFCEGLTIPYNNKVGISLFNCPMGFVLPDEKIAVLTAKELFNIKIKSIAYSDKFKEGAIIKSFEDLSPGDYVVHEYEGIGKFVKLETLLIEGQSKDFLKLIYRNDELLYVPLSQFHLVRKYIGKEGFVPRLSKLHGKDWENTKQKIKERISDLAKRLMDLYIERSKVKGISFRKDDEMQEDFEKDFLYALTEDQERSLREIKEDMESERPMDRLLCGDVGFGKTELAFRAAFKAILSGKQVAFLCPTTLLARQHYELAKDRFLPYGVNVGMLSRLTNPEDEENYVKQVNNGQMDLIIGTHRLLSKDIQFKNLGLLIIDEEQRFGVEQKEKIKAMKTNIDVLTISATPIPRTLQISLLGVRSLSQINTPPHERMPIQTYVTPYKPDVIKELISRELSRNGQVFYLHNQVIDIYRKAAEIQELVPNAKVGVAHGQMNKKAMEDVMISFYNGDLDVLIATSIVENGIDVPNANMIIVEDSQRYGLAQLYQIKGRVGRSDRIAYAYLMYPDSRKLNDKARERLKALQEFTELGSGYKIAQRDLLIRGAGDVLGPEQAGFIDNIGLDMYLKLLNDAVKEKMEGGQTEEKPLPLFATLSGEAFIPDSYASDADKIELYQEINSCENYQMIVETKQKMTDIYGKIPPETELLFKKRLIDIHLNQADVKEIKEYTKFVDLVLGTDFSNIRGIGNIMVQTLMPFVSFTKITYRDRKFFITMYKREGWLDDLTDLLKSLSNIYTVNTVKEPKV